MKNILIIAVTLQLCIFVKSTDIDAKYLKCLVCRATMDELKKEVDKINPLLKINVGDFRMDAEGNSNRKSVSKVRSEIFIMDMLDDVCGKMSDYVKATNKSDGRLIILNLMDTSGYMNPKITEVDLIQDGELNKSLVYNCESIVEEFEIDIVNLFSMGKTDIKRTLCTDIAELCNEQDFAKEDKEDEMSEKDEEYEMIEKDEEYEMSEKDEEDDEMSEKYEEKKKMSEKDEEKKKMSEKDEEDDEMNEKHEEKKMNEKHEEKKMSEKDEL